MPIIPVFFTFDRNYVVAAAVTIYSLLKKSSPEFEYQLYVLHTELTTSDEKKLQKIVCKFSNASLSFINVSSYDPSGYVFTEKAHYSKEIFYKLIVADIFPQYDRIICSDVDVLFAGDISESYFLFENQFFYFAGVGEVESDDPRMDYYRQYFVEDEIKILEKEIAAGYLLINLKAIRDNQKQKELTNFYVNNYQRLLFPEQDCIILCCWPAIKYLPLKYVVLNNYYRWNVAKIDFNQEYDYLRGDKKLAIDKFNEALKSPVQIHYVGNLKPWNSLFIPKQDLWIKELIDSGFLCEFIKKLPVFIYQRIKICSFKRFLLKMKQSVLQNKKK